MPIMSSLVLSSGEWREINAQIPDAKGKKPDRIDDYELWRETCRPSINRMPTDKRENLLFAFVVEDKLRVERRRPSQEVAHPAQGNHGICKRVAMCVSHEQEQHNLGVERGKQCCLVLSRIAQVSCTDRRLDNNTRNDAIRSGSLALFSHFV